MPSFERGVYEPKPDDIRVFDEDEQDMDEEGSRLPLLIVIALMVLAAFGGVVWLAYNQGVQRGRSDAPRMIVAAPGPTKEAAANPDATHNLKIYQQPAPSDDEAVGENVLSPSANEANAPPPNEAAKSVPAQMAARPEATMPAPTNAKPETSRSAPVKAVAHATTKPAPKIEPAALKPAETKPAASTLMVAKPVETATLAPVTGAKEASEATNFPPAPETAAPASGAYMLQIGAYKSQAEADTAWSAFKAKHPAAGVYSEDVRRADLGNKGVWYRLRMGSFTDKSAAAAFCEKLKAEGGSCLIAK